MTITVVGPCASGKTTLAEALRAEGYSVNVPAQEHSAIADLWQRKGAPDVLVFLDVGLEAVRQRRQSWWAEERLQRQRERLAHARTHADIVIDTDALDPPGVLAEVLARLES
ncbi:MAG: AAA family ATPase [Chloroflexi bacterium]|nr:AAA family ATPase [Chloroflexota bacterium]